MNKVQERWKQGDVLTHPYDGEGVVEEIRQSSAGHGPWVRISCNASNYASSQSSLMKEGWRLKAYSPSPLRKNKL